MKKKRLITNIVAAGLVLVAFVGVFLNMWTLYTKNEILNQTKVLGNITIFENNFPNDAIFGTICEVLLIIALVLGCLYVICYLLGFVGIGKINWNKVLKLVALLEILIALVAIIFGIIFCVLQSNINEYLSTILIPNIGFYMLALGTLLSGVVGVFANRK